jgi:hypothetical protein
MTGMVILVSTAPLEERTSTDVLSTNEAVPTSITIPVVLMICPLTEQYSLVLPFHLRNGNTSEYCFISGQNIGTTGIVILVSTASLVVRTSVQQE